MRRYSPNSRNSSVKPSNPHSNRTLTLSLPLGLYYLKPYPLPLDPLPETEKKQEDTTNPSVDKTFENEVTKNNEETPKENPTMDQPKPPEV